MANNHKNNTKSFIQDFSIICNNLNLSSSEVISNITTIIKDFKDDCLKVEENIESELIRICLTNNHVFNMINQLNLVTYAGPQYDVSKI